MILVGLTVEMFNVAGHTTLINDFFSTSDIHEAAKETWKAGKETSPFRAKNVLFGEFHDTETQTTWSVDSAGHTKRDYRRETDEQFAKRWRDRLSPRLKKRQDEAIRNDG